MTDVSALQGFWVGVFLSALVWVQLGRWSLLLLMRRSWRAQQQRQLARREVPRPYVEHAGQYVDRDRVRAGVRMEPPDWFRRAG